MIFIGMEKSLVGILVETKVRNGIVFEMVVGIGINTNKEKFEGELEGKATSIKKEFDVRVDREEFLLEIWKLGRFLFQNLRKRVSV